MNGRAFLRLLVLWLLVGPFAGVRIIAQPPQVVVDHVSVDQLTVADLDFQAGGGARYLFSISITGIAGIQPALRIDVGAELPGQPPIDVVHCGSAGPLPQTFTNLDIGSRVEITCSPINQVILDAALATGNFPAGRYTFVFTLVQNTTELARAQFTLDVRNVSRLDLLSPRDGEEVSTTFPLFQWIFDGSRVELSVYERLPQHSSREEAAQGVPHLCVVLDNIRSFQYPSSSTSQACPGTVVRNLEPGKRYVWRVRGLTDGAGGGGTGVHSEIWEFAVPIGAGQAMHIGGEANPQSLSNQIQNIPGIDPQLLARLIAGDLQPTGVVIVDGVHMTWSQVMAILNDLSINPDKIIDIQVVDR